MKRIVRNSVLNNAHYTHSEKKLIYLLYPHWLFTLQNYYY